VFYSLQDHLRIRTRNLDHPVLTGVENTGTTIYSVYMHNFLVLNQFKEMPLITSPMNIKQIEKDFDKNLMSYMRKGGNGKFI
jgi:hypothetical protein